ncbi:TetR/AcrR family transcriptional regulator C-terminal domain-containing protein [Arthrobacter sp. TWP1-1]|uniref:TetR/AcrR family transcriptional regulator C-terminal domain-containing protein n=1 Tax=Arthrobacter sp. TWP1-1 TaxID=2804568 RepID=UPI003CF682AC
MPLTRDQVIETAFEILRDYGLADLSMRRLARDLGVQPGALYWHVKNKQELLGVLSVMILMPADSGPTGAGARGVADPDADADPVAAAETEAFAALHLQSQAIRRALLRVRDGAEVVALTHAIDPESLTVLRRLTLGFEAAGLRGHNAGWAARALVHYILGSVTEEQTRSGLIQAGVLESSADPADADSAFEFGLRLLLTGAATATGAPR